MDNSVCISYFVLMTNLYNPVEILYKSDYIVFSL